MKNEKELKELKEILTDLIWINGIIATELIRITENTAAILKGKQTISPCGPQHAKINEKIIEILEKYLPEKTSILREHVLKHE
ncbi:MAG: hypothetical protein QXV37_02610 [Candidatus Jordarchaeaceae archaeon]